MTWTNLPSSPAKWAVVAELKRSALVLRASAHRYLDALDLAFADASRALELSPLHPEALLERGIVARIQGRKNAARRDWLNLLKYYEGTPAGDAAQRNLEWLEVSAK